MYARIFFPFLFFSLRPFAQEVKLPPIIQKLAQYKGSVLPYELNNTNFLSIPDLPKNYQESGENFIKNKNHLLLLPKGTGRIYRLDSSQNHLHWTRIDSTVYIGYNFGCYSFEYDGSIYSFGGDGFWSTNGNLRVFNKNSNEWNAKSLSESIHVSFPAGGDNFHFIDTTTGKLYVRTHHYKHDLTTKDNVDTLYGNTFYELDIKSGDWTRLGRSYEFVSMIGVSPWGPMINFDRIVDLNRNTILEFNDITKQKIVGILANSTNDNIRNIGYFIDSVYYFGNFNGFIDSISFSRKDLIDTGKPFYFSDEKSALTLPSPKAEWLIIVVLSMLSSILYWKYRKQKPALALQTASTTHSEKQPPTEELEKLQNQFRSSKIVNLLDEREKLLLTLLYEQSSEERLTSIEEINRVIGVLNRSTEIQKRLRSDIITSINSKMGILHSEKKPVVDKQRSDFDKRSFEYFIQPVHMELVEKVLG